MEGVGFVFAKNLQPGDIIRTSDGKNLPILKVEIEELEEPVLVYNFEAEDFHTYYVSELGVLVHNMCGKLKDTRNIRYSQDNIGSKFSDNSSVNEMIYSLKSNPSYAEQIEPIRLVKFKNLPENVQNRLKQQGVSEFTVFSLDNRRLYAAKQARTKIKTRWATKEELLEINLDRRFSTVTGGKYINVRR